MDTRIAELDEPRGEMLSRLSPPIKEAVPDVAQERKWRIRVWSRNGLICTAKAYKKAVRMTFAKGTTLMDRPGRFSFSLEGNVRCAVVDSHEGEKPDKKALNALIRAAEALNKSAA